MKNILFDFNNMLDCNVGSKDGATRKDLIRITKAAKKACDHLTALYKDPVERVKLGLEWMHLPFQDKKTIAVIQRLGNSIAAQYENVIFLGIGGSYLGLKAAQDALTSPYYNEFRLLRKRRPKVYFEGNNVDPQTFSTLLAQLDARKTFIVVISKSGETTETKAACIVAEQWLKDNLGGRFGRHILAITDPESGQLREKADVEHSKDACSYRSLPLMKGVGGRFSELNMGLLHLAVIGINIGQVLKGAQAMARRCWQRDLYKNPALMYAALQNILYTRKRKHVAILMPFSEQLRATADWYCQLLAESLGKKYARKIVKAPNGREMWERDVRRAIYVGRTPVATCGTKDLHSIHQNNVEGENDKTITFIKIARFDTDIAIPGTDDLLSGASYAELLALAEEATAWALARANRPNCTIVLPELDAFHWGGLLFFFEMATAFEGELLNVNAFDQPGVEGYKHYMYYTLGKSGISGDIAEDIQKNPLVKQAKFIL